MRVCVGRNVWRSGCDDDQKKWKVSALRDYLYGSFETRPRANPVPGFPKIEHPSVIPEAMFSARIVGT